NFLYTLASLHILFKMAKYHLLLPKMGESVSEATIVKWMKQIGEPVDIDDIIVEIATDKVDSEVPSPVSGVLVEQLFKEDDIAQMGDAIAILEIEDGEEETSTPPDRAIEQGEQTVVEVDDSEEIPGIELVEEPEQRQVEDV